MTSFQSPLLTERVPYDWDELKRAAQQAKSETAPASDEGLIALAPIPHRHVVHPDAASHAQTAALSPEAEVAASKPQAEAQGALDEDELIARLVPKVVERLNSQIEIIVDVTLKTAGGRIRSDLQKAVENAVRLTVREELSKKQKSGE